MANNKKQPQKNAAPVKEAVKGTTTTTETGENTQNQSGLMVNAQYIKDFSFENPNPLSSFTTQGAPDISINIQVGANKVQERSFEVALKINVDAKRGKDAVFVLELVYGGIFTIGKEVPEEMIRPVLMIECPRILFPFARSIVASTTQDGGYPALLLTPVDFTHLYQQQMAAEDAKEKKAATAH